MNAAPTFIDLFCGCGGLTAGLVEAGLTHQAGYDWDERAVANYNLNFPARGHVADVTQLNLPRGAAEVLVAGLPCQSFSTLGKLDQHDPRNDLWEAFLCIMEQVDPLVWGVENVARFLKTPQCEALVSQASAMGYIVSTQVVKAVDFGVPQRRPRAMIIGAKRARPREVVGNAAALSVREAFEGLPKAPNGRNMHLARSPTPLPLERYRHVPPGGSRRDLPEELQNPCWLRLGRKGATNVFGRLEWHKPADTLRTTFLKPETDRYIHPEADRGLTVREGMRLQGFPDSFVMEGAMHTSAEQVGNAVPPPVAKAVGEELLRLATVDITRKAA